MRTAEELMNLDLSKWPQCIVTGTPVSKDLALDIIRRTDRVFKYIYCNDSKRGIWLKETLHMPIEPKIGEGTPEQIKQYFQDERKWSEKWGFVFLQYLDNDWVASIMAQGAHGWMHPDGTIGYFYNIGKWPEVHEVLEELNTIVQNWPTLELEVTLMDKEYGEEDSKPIVSFLVRNGKVEFVDPEERNIHEEFNRTVPSAAEVENMSIDNFRRTLMKGYDCKISDEVILSWAKFAE